MAVGSPVASLFVEFGSDVSGFDKGVSQVESGLSKVKSGIGNVVSTAAGFAVASAGIAGVGTVIDGVVGSTVNFDKSMREINTLLKLNDTDFKKLENQVLKTSTSLGVDATQSAQALYQAISSGVPADNVISFMETSTKAAIAGSADLGVVVDATSGVLKTYGMEFSEAGRLQDMFFQTVNDGVTTMPELGSALGGVAPIAQAAGVSVEEMLGVFSTLTGVTGNTSEVATQLKGALTSVIKPSAEASKMAEQMGLDFSVSALQSKGLAGFLQEVGEKSEGFAKESGVQTIDVLGKLFGSVEGLNGVLALTGSQQDAFGQKLENMNNAAGNTDAAFSEMNKSFSRMMEMGKERVEALGIKVGMFLLPIMFSLGAKVQELASAVFPHLMAAWDALQGPIALVRDGILTFIQALSGNWTDAEGIHPLHAAIGNLGLTIRDTVIPAFLAVAGAVQNFVTLALPYVMQFADWFITVGIPAITGFATTVIDTVTGQILPAVSSFVDTVLPYLMQFGDWFVTTAVPAIQNFATQAATLFTTVILPAVQSFIDTVLPRLQEFFNTLVSHIPTVMSLGETLTGAFTSISETVSTVFAVVGPILSAVFDSIMVAATTIIPSLVGIWTTLSAQWSASTPLIESIKNLFTQLQPALIAIGVVIGTVLVVAVGILMGVLGGLAGFLNGVLPGAIQVVTGAINVVSGVLQVFSSLILGIVNVVSALLHGEWGEAWNAAKEMVSGMAAGVMQIISGLVGMVTGAISGLVGGVIGLISGFVSSIIGFFENLYHTLVGGSIVPDMVNEIINVIAGLPGAVIGIISGFVSSVLGFFSDLAVTVGTSVANLVTGVVTGFTNLASQIPGVVSGFVFSVLGFFQDLVTDAVAKVGELVTSIPGKIGEMATEAVSSMGTFVTDAVAKVAELPGKAVAALGDLGSTLLSAGSDLIGGFISGITSKIPDVEGALGGLTSKLTSWKGPPEKDAVLLTESGHLVMEGFIRGLQALFPDVQSTLEDFTAKFADGGVKNIADAMSALFNATKAGVDALNSLATLVIPSNDTVTAFRTAVEFVISELAGIAGMFSEETAKSAKTFADGAGPLLSLVSSGVEGLSKLVEFVAPANESISGFKFSVEHLLRSLSDTANTFSEEALTHAKVFADTVGPMLSFLSDGVAGLTSFADFVKPAESAISEFKFSVEHLVRSLGDSAAMFSTEFLTSAKTFADTAGPILDLLSSVADLTAVADFVRPADSAISEFKFSLEHLVRSLADTAAMFTEEGLAHARVFAENAGPIVDLLASVPESFATLDAFVGPGEGAFLRYKDFLVWIVDEFIGNSTNQFTEEGLAGATRFVDAAGKIVDLLGSVPQSFASLDAFIEPTEAAFLNFKAFLVWIVDEFVGTSTAQFEQAGLEAANRFVDTAGKILDLIGKGVDGIADLGDFEFTSDAKDGLDRWVAFIGVAIRKLQEASKRFDSDGLETANAFADTANAVMDVIGKASDFSALGDFGDNINAGIDNFFSAIKTAVQKLIEIGNELGSGLTEAADIAKKIAEIVGLLTSASISPASPSGGSSGDGSSTPSGGSSSGGSGGKSFGFGSPVGTPGAVTPDGGSYSAPNISGGPSFGSLYKPGTGMTDPYHAAADAGVKTFQQFKEWVDKKESEGELTVSGGQPKFTQKHYTDKGWIVGPDGKLYNTDNMTPSQIAQLKANFAKSSTSGGRSGLSALALGGITTGPMAALIGDNPGGKEAVIPLDRLPEMVDRVNARFASANEAARDIGVTVHVTNTYQLDGRELSQAVAKQIAQEVRTQGGALPRR